MRDGAINGGSQFQEVLGILTGQWQEFDRNGWHVVLTPFFVVLTATLDAGKTPLPYKFKVPVAGTVAYADGSVGAVIVKPGENAVEIAKPGIMQFNVFGDSAEPTPA